MALSFTPCSCCNRSTSEMPSHTTASSPSTAGSAAGLVGTTLATARELLTSLGICGGKEVGGRGTARTDTAERVAHCGGHANRVHKNSLRGPAGVQEVGPRP